VKIRKLLIANRGEIAIRIIRSCRELDIRTVAVFSEADIESLHVKYADEAIAIGPSEASESYLNIPRVIDAALATGSDAVHPGYGFLSERPEFAEACKSAGLIFVGPSADAMRALGDKISAKNLAVEAGVPIVPGFFEPGASPEKLAEEAGLVGYPVMLKASAGGGGRGMRVVRSSLEFDDSLALATDEALKAFGDGTMMVEKLIERPRHIEIQILADSMQGVACLFERECSIQRRHQKLLEEAPSPFLRVRPDLWKDMRAAAKSIVLKAGYTNAGTVEFIVDSDSGEFFFLEVNARLQVEHPVTEAITGLDLVKEQIRIAEGHPLGIEPAFLKGERDRIAGHAIEVRIIAEDPEKGFLPSAGKILAWAEPLDSRVRVDAGFAQGAIVPQYYDSLLAKVIAHGATRPEAVARLRGALLDFHILGVRTNIGYLLDVIGHPKFLEGDLDTGFLGRYFRDWAPDVPPEELSQLVQQSSAPVDQTAEPKRSQTPAWCLGDSFRIS
jgi:acetyl-CoA carboxylase biotin carboxylase subunit